MSQYIAPICIVGSYRKGVPQEMISSVNVNYLHIILPQRSTKNMEEQSIVLQLAREASGEKLRLEEKIAKWQANLGKKKAELDKKKLITLALNPKVEENLLVKEAFDEGNLNRDEKRALDVYNTIAALEQEVMLLEANIAEAKANEEKLRLDAKIEKWQGELMNLIFTMKTKPNSDESMKAEILKDMVTQNIAEAKEALAHLTSGDYLSKQISALSIGSPNRDKRSRDGGSDETSPIKLQQTERIYKVDCLIPNGARMRELRKTLYMLAENNLAYEPCDISYNVAEGEAIKSDTGLRVKLHFRNGNKASKMLVAIRDLVRRYNEELPLRFEVLESNESLGRQIFKDRYDSSGFPKRRNWDAIDAAQSETTAESTSKLTTEDIENESPINPDMFKIGQCKAEWAHIKERTGGELYPSRDKQSLDLRCKSPSDV